MDTPLSRKTVGCASPALHESRRPDQAVSVGRAGRDPFRLAQEAPPKIRTLGTAFGHSFLLEQDGGVTLIDAGLSGDRDTPEPALSLFDSRLRNAGLATRQPLGEGAKTMPGKQKTGRRVTSRLEEPFTRRAVILG